MMMADESKYVSGWRPASWRALRKHRHEHRGVGPVAAVVPMTTSVSIVAGPGRACLPARPPYRSGHPLQNWMNVAGQEDELVERLHGDDVSGATSMTAINPDRNGDRERRSG